MIGTGSLFEEERDGESVKLIVKRTKKVLSTKDNYAGTPIMAVSGDGGSGYKRWNLAMSSSFANFISYHAVAY